jgi:hypothetical protein
MRFRDLHDGDLFRFYDRHRPYLKYSDTVAVDWELGLTTTVNPESLVETMSLTGSLPRRKV